MLLYVINIHGKLLQTELSNFLEEQNCHLFKTGFSAKLSYTSLYFYLMMFFKAQGIEQATGLLL